MSYRKLNLITFIITVSLLACALFLQNYLHLSPCPLCIFQRLAFIGLAVLFFIGTAFPRFCKRFCWQPVMIIVIACSGLGVAIRQLWLQNLPADQVPTCGPGLNYLLENFPLSQTVQMVLKGSGECAVVDWRFLGLSMAAWSAIYLALFAMVGLLFLLKKSKI